MVSLASCGSEVTAQPTFGKTSVVFESAHQKPHFCSQAPKSEKDFAGGDNLNRAAPERNPRCVQSKTFLHPWRYH